LEGVDRNQLVEQLASAQIPAMILLSGAGTQTKNVFFFEPD